MGARYWNLSPPEKPRRALLNEPLFGMIAVALAQKATGFATGPGPAIGTATTTGFT